MATILEYGLLNASFVAVLACLVYVLCLFIKRPEIRHTLWVLVLLKLVIPPIFGVPVWLRETLETEPERQRVAEPLPAAELFNPSTSMDISILPEFGGDVGFGPLPPIDIIQQEKQSPRIVEAASVANPKEALAPVTPVRLVAWWIYLGYVWVGVSGILLGLLVWRALRFSRLLRHSKLAPPEVFALVNELRKRLELSHTPYVRVTQEKMWPSLWAPIPFSNYATILIPEPLLNQLNDQEKRAILTHELVHLRRGDPCWRWLEVSASILFWWFPLVSWIRKNLHTAEEACCDLYTVEVLADRRAYASALVETAWFVGNSGTPLLTSGVGPIVNLKRRITMVMQPKTLRKSRWVLAAVLAAGVTVLAFGPAIAQPGTGKGSKAVDPSMKDGKAPPTGSGGSGGFGGPPGPLGGGGGEGVKEPSAEEVKKAREEYRKAVEEFLKAREKLTDAENALRKVDRSSVGGFGGIGGFPGGPGVPVPSNPSVPVGPGGGRPPVGPGMGGGFPGMPGVGPSGPPAGGFPGMGGPGGGPVVPMGMGGAGGPPRGMGGMGLPGGPGIGAPPMGMNPRDPMNTPRPIGMGGMGGGFQPMGMGPRDSNPELQKQLEDLKRQLDELKRQLENRRGGGDAPPPVRPGAGGRDGKDPAPRPVRPSGGSGDGEELPRVS